MSEKPPKAFQDDRWYKAGAVVLEGEDGDTSDGSAAYAGYADVQVKFNGPWVMIAVDGTEAHVYPTSRIRAISNVTVTPSGQGFFA